MSTTFKDDRVVGFITSSVTDCQKDENGRWVVKQKVVQRRSFDGEKWEQKEAEVSSIDSDLDKALEHSFLTMAIYLENMGGYLFEKDEDNILVDKQGGYTQ